MASDLTDQEKYEKAKAYVDWQHDTFFLYVKKGIEAGVDISTMEKFAPHVWNLDPKHADMVMKQAILSVAVDRRQKALKASGEEVEPITELCAYCGSNYSR